MNMLNIKNKLYTAFNNFVNIFNVNSKKLSDEKVGSDDLCIYYIYYAKNSFYLVIDDSKGYFEKNDDNGNKHLSKSKYLIVFGIELKNLLTKSIKLMIMVESIQ